MVASNTYARVRSDISNSRHRAVAGQLRRRASRLAMQPNKKSLYRLWPRNLGLYLEAP